MSVTAKRGHTDSRGGGFSYYEKLFSSRKKLLFPPREKLLFPTARNSFFLLQETLFPTARNSFFFPREVPFFPHDVRLHRPDFFSGLRSQERLIMPHQHGGQFSRRGFFPVLPNISPFFLPFWQKLVLNSAFSKNIRNPDKLCCPPPVDLSRYLLIGLNLYTQRAPYC